MTSNTHAGVMHAAHVPSLSSRRRTGRLARRPGSLDLRGAGIGGWGWTLFCLALCIVVFELPFFRVVGTTGSPSTVRRPYVGHPTGELELTPVVSIDAADVTLDGCSEASPDAIRAGDADALRPFREDLARLRRNWSLAHPAVPFPGAVLVLAPTDTDWAVMGPTLRAAAAEGYTRVSFAVEANLAYDPAIEWARFGAER